MVIYVRACIFSSSDFGKYCFEILPVGYIYSQVLFIKITWFDIININENQFIMTGFARLTLLRLFI